MSEREFLVKWTHPHTGKQERSFQVAESGDRAVTVFCYQQGNAGVFIDRSKVLAGASCRFTVRTPDPSVYTLVDAWDRADAIDEGFEELIRDGVAVTKGQLTAERS